MYSELPSSTYCIGIESIDTCSSLGQANLALSSNGVTCNASRNALQCDRAIDGIAETTSVTFMWGFFNEPVDQWIQLNFSSTLTYSYFRIQESSLAVEKNIKDLELTFSSDPPQQVR